MTGPRETRDHRGHLTKMTVDGVIYRADDRGPDRPDGLFQIVPDGNRQEFPRGAMRSTSSDLETGATP